MRSKSRRGSKAAIQTPVDQQHKRAATVATQFKGSLADLMTKMMSASPHFVRCIKPNARLQSDNFAKDLVTTQLQYTGVMETIRIRRDGYPVRLEFSEFVRRYQVVSFPLTKEIPDIDACAACVKILSNSAVTALLHKMKKVDVNFEIGKTKVFLKFYVIDVLTQVLEFFHSKATFCQKIIRGFLAHRKVAKLRQMRAEEERKRVEEEKRKREELEAAERARIAKEQELARLIESQKLREAELDRRARELDEKQQASMLMLESEHSKIKTQAMEEARRSLANASASPSASPTPMSPTNRIASAVASVHGGSTRRRRMRVAPMKIADFEGLDLRLVAKDKIPPGTESKNRYMNILPPQRSRVQLDQIGADETSTYINANHIQGYNGCPREYIATQGPKTDTVNDFWRMVWQYKVKAIVMVTGLVEKGVEKCARYWPTKLYNVKEKLGDVQYGEFNVRVAEGARKDGYVTSQLRVRCNEEERAVRHYWFDSWPDHGACMHHHMSHAIP